MGVAGAEGQGEEEAEHSPEHRQQRQGGGQGGGTGTPEEGRGIPEGGAVLPHRQGQDGQRRQQADDPSGAQPHPHTEADRQQGAAVDGGEQGAQAGGVGAEAPGQQPAGEDQAEGGGTEKPHRPGQGRPGQGDDDEIGGKAEPGHGPGQGRGQAGGGPLGGGAFQNSGGQGVGPPFMDQGAGQAGHRDTVDRIHPIIPWRQGRGKGAQNNRIPSVCAAYPRNVSKLRQFLPFLLVCGGESAVSLQKRSFVQKCAWGRKIRLDGAGQE